MAAVPSAEVPAGVMEVFEMWCQWLDVGEENFPLAQVVQLLAQGGENFRSLLQFMTRVSEPHRAELPATDSDEDVREACLRRSCVAMQVACHALAGPSFAPVLEGGGVILAAACYELLGGLQPRSKGCSLHICTVLQHILSAREAEVTCLLLQYHAPFVLLRALDRPGCGELLQSLLGCDVVLPKIVPNAPTRPLRPSTLQQVRQYLLAYEWSSWVAAVLDSGARLSGGGPGASAESSPVRRASVASISSPGPRTPVRKASGHSPRTPGISTPGKPGIGFCSPRMATPCSTPQRFPGNGATEASPFKSLDAPPSSPSMAQAPSFLDLPVRPLERPQETRPQDANEPEKGLGGSACRGPSRPVRSPEPSSLEPDLGNPEDSDGRGINVLIEFLSALLASFGRSAEVMTRNRLQQREDNEELELKTQEQAILLRFLFLETSLVPHLFQLLQKSSAHFEAASLLEALLQHALNPRRCHPDLVEPLVAKCLPDIELLGRLISRSRVRRPSGGPRMGKSELRLNGYTVQEPLGALRVLLVQILAALCELKPECALPSVKPAVWSVLVRWFFTYRCNHIFQAACGRLWIAVVKHGSAQLQHLIFMKLRLLGKLCDAVLAEGACGDRWHESRCVKSGLAGSTDSRVEKSQVMTCRARHPGGLGGIVPVINAMVARAQEVDQKVPVVPRAPLAERSVPQALPDAHSKKAAPPANFMASLLEATSVWRQVIKAIEPSMPYTQPTAIGTGRQEVVSLADAS